MFQDFGASLLNFTMANPTDFQSSFFSADCERDGRGKTQIANENRIGTASKLLLLNS
jgi:hypothetical protein